ncbi:MAG: peptidoglycan DD-metalloendopeptidase family protein [Propionibacteriales bacterium]|nr:peptidoglycan DD-metalloendopeptidase family protein [Propionibacteriales bacterium]
MSSPTSSDVRQRRRRRWLTPLAGLVATVSLSLVLGGITPAAADDLNDARDKVRKQMVQAKKQVAADKSALAKAEARLRASEAALTAAKADLADAESKLGVAQGIDAALLAQLQTAEAELAAAAQVEQAAQQGVNNQRDLIGEVAREAYQEHSGMVSISILLDADTPRDLASRMHWNDTVFDTTAAEFQRLSELQAQAQAAREARQATEEAVAAKRAESAANVAATKVLADRAAASRAKVASLVAENAKLRKAAQNELESSKAQYEKLQREEAKISAKIRGEDGDYSNPNGFIKPVNAPAGSPFGMRYHPILHYWRMHWGTDFGAACGTPIRAMANGKVISAGWTTYGFGNYTIISYGKMFGANLSSGYAHQSKVIVHAGQKVKQGQIVGYVGTTGLSTGCHLHLQIYRNGVRVNPMRYL